MAIDITRHHHERFDSKGCRDRLAGAAIPLSARMVAIGGVYDALGGRRVYKPANSIRPCCRFFSAVRSVSR
jgi:putative two-component system response regulator